jgi:hypothetical protein
MVFDVGSVLHQRGTLALYMDDFGVYQARPNFGAILRDKARGLLIYAEVTGNALIRTLEGRKRFSSAWRAVSFLRHRCWFRQKPVRP